MALATGKVWLITGTSSGFGRRLVSLALARRDRVIATARTLTEITRDPELQRSSNVHCAQLDISSGTERVKARINDIIRGSGWNTVDVLVNNAGIGCPAFVEEGGTEFMRHQFQTNLFGTLDVTTAVLPYMRKQRSGTIVMVGSRSSWKPELKAYGFYSSSKAAVRAISETLASELEPFGIRMLIVEPGSFRTEKIYRNDMFGSNPIPDYDGMRQPTATAFKAPAGKQRGDPTKAMQAVVDIVCGEGRAQGKPWPLYLVLGKDAESDVRQKCTRMITYLDEWADVIKDVDLDEEAHL